MRFLVDNALSPALAALLTEARPSGTCFSIRRMRCLVRTDVCAAASCSGRTSPRLMAS